VVSSFWSKRIKDKKLKQEVAKDLGIEEHKIQELIDGKRHIGGETMDKVLQSINDNNENSVAKDLEILDWYTNTNLKDLRKEWGYGQIELANKLGLNSNTLNSIESKYQFKGHISKTVKNLYEFYHNEFNKKLKPIGKNARVNVNGRKAKKQPIIEETFSILSDQPVVTIDDIGDKKVEFNVQPIFNDDIVIKISSNGEITYIENGKEIQNITELHLNKLGNEKPVLDIKLSRTF